MEGSLIRSFPPTIRMLPPRGQRVALLGIPILAALMIADTLSLGGGQLLWERAHLTFSSALALTVCLVAMANSSGRTRAVIGWITAAIAFWTVSEVIRSAEALAGVGSRPGISDLTFVGVLVCAVAAYVAALRGRLSSSEERAVYLDGAIVFFGTAAVLLVLFSDTASASLSGAIDLAYAIFFLATVLATLLLDLAVLAERRLRGAYMVLLGLTVIGLAFVWRLFEPPVGVHISGAPGQLISIGIVVTMFGTVTWSDHVDQTPSYVRLARRLRSALPIATLVLSPVVMAAVLVLEVGGAVGLLAVSALGLALITVAVRQSVLLHDRQAAVDRERRLARSVSEAQERYRTLIERIHGVVYIAEAGADGRWHYVSPQIEQMLGYTPQEWLADPDLWANSLHPEDRAGVLDDEDLPASQRRGATGSWEYRLRTRDGRELWVLDDEAVVAADEQGRPTLVQGILLDITERRQAEEALRSSQEQLERILDTASYAFIGMDAGGVIVDWNRQAEAIFGWTRAEALGRTVAETIIPPDKRGAHEAGLARFGTTGEGPILGNRMEVTALHRDGRTFPIDVTVWAVGNGDDYRFSALIDDITTRKALEDQLRHQAFHDPLSGLANRALFIDRLEHALDLQERESRPEALSVLFLDLDDFKTINDSLGHAAGDELLGVIGERLSGAVRREDTAARLGGDEFAILLEHADEPKAIALATRLVATLRQSTTIQGRQFAPSASIGIVSVSVGGSSPDEVLRNADLAMYVAKDQGKNRYAVYRPSMHEVAVRRLEVKAELERHDVLSQMRLAYQPIVDLPSREVQAVEALIRWHHPEWGVLEPMKFVPLAEETGQIVPIGRWVLTEACSTIQRLSAVAGGPLEVHVNVSPVQLEDGAFVETVREVLALTQLDPCRLVLEITEGALLRDTEWVLRVLEALKAIGVQLALDDFGTGFSSLSYLRRFPIDVIKIDQSFAEPATRPEGAALARSIVSLGQSLGMRTIAEGIETPIQLAALLRLGCRLGQGFLISEPLAPDDLVALLGARPDERASARVG